MFRVAGIASAAVIGVVLLGIVVALAWLHTGGGAHQLGELVTGKARGAIRGNLTVRGIQVRGLLTICADQVDLRDPDGNPALAADRVCLRVNPLALRANKVLVSDVQLVRPRIDIAAVVEPDGRRTTTLSRALAARRPPSETQPQSGPFKWVIDVSRLQLEDGSIALRPAPDAAPSFSLGGASLTAPHARYAADGGDARIALRAQLTSPGTDPVALDVDAQLTGDVKSGNVEVRELRVSLGESGFSSQGNYDLGASTGELHLRELRVLPRDLAVITRGAQPPLSGEVRGSADATLQGNLVSLTARLTGGGGRIQIEGRAALRTAEWQVALTLQGVDPAGVARAAPAGEVSGRLEAKGRGLPVLDAHGVRGDLSLRAHVGPARIDRVGEVRLDAQADVQGRQALVRAFTATALGLRVSANGTASFEAVALDVDVQAPDLQVVGHAVGALRKQPSFALAGSAHLSAHVTGSPRSPDARIHLRAPAARVGDQFSARALAVDGTLHGRLSSPDGNLRLSAEALDAGQIAMREPRIEATLSWPWAHLRIDSAVHQGQLLLAGDARIDDDRDGLRLANFTVAWPGNEMRLAHDTRIHFREGVTIVEPLDLVGEHGSLRLSAQLTPSRVDAAAVVKEFDLSRLPRFVLPSDLGQYGRIDGNVVVNGPKSRPDLDLEVDLRGAGVRRTADLPLDAHAHAHLHGGRLRAEGFVRAQGGGPELTFDADAPVQALPQLAPGTPVRADVQLRDADLGQLADRLHIEPLRRQELKGSLAARLLATGTLGAPHATLSIEARELATRRVRDVQVRAGMVLENGRASLDGAIAIAGEQTVSLSGQAPFDLSRAVRDRSYLGGALQRPVQLDLAVAQLPLERLARAGALPDNAAGEVSASLRLGGTPLAPQLALSARGEGITSGKVRGLSFQTQLDVDQAVKLAAGAQANGDSIGRLDGTVALSGAELVQLARAKGSSAAVEPLLGRSVSVALEVPGLLVGRMANLAGRDRTPAEGWLQGRLSLTGSPASPQLRGQFQLRDVAREQKRLGNADLYVEANSDGALVHLGINPPGGGSFLGHANLVADLGARSLLRKGAAAVRDGELSGDLDARHLDLAFLSGLAPGVRDVGGTLDAHVKIAGLLGRPKPEGKAQLRGGHADIVGQGVFQDISLDASFSPKEAVVDRLTGTINGGTFSAVLVGSQRPATDQQALGAIDFTGEVHLGDDESVRGRTVNGKPVQKAAVPLRQAGEERATVQGELDVFGDFTDGLLTVNGKIPDANIRIVQLQAKKLPSLDPHPDVLLVHPGEKPHPPGKEPEEVEAEIEARQRATFRLHAKLDIEHLYVAAEDFEFPVESHLTFDYDAQQPGAPTAEGTITVPQGTFSALGRRFVIEYAKITETGGDITDPELDIRARFENPKATVNIVISGTAKEPQIDLTSNPPMDPDAIAFFLATGHLEGRAVQNGGGVDLSGAASSVLGSLLFGELRKTLANVLPVDVLTIETQGTGVAQARVGKYIGDRIFIGYRQRLTASTPNENTVEARLEYEISRSVSIEATVGDITRDLSVLFTHDF
ncbi:MAG TPA: translocation/assembly module TamB domain-containing protein [Myxococcales bacterium]|nr:translocation/assembly module TamB domain-containing protein [Myxococcales bacterium]